MDETTKTIFKNNLNYFIDFDTEQEANIERFKQNIHDSVELNDLDSLTSFETFIKNIQRLSRMILNAYVIINFAHQDIAFETWVFNNNCRMFQSHFTALSPGRLDLLSINAHLISIREYLKNIKEIIDLNFHFNYIWNVEPTAAAEFEKYVSRGILINSDQEYIGSPIETLENFVLDRVNAIKNYIGDDFTVGDDDYSNLFFAIVAPSMTGKTQAAFAFKRLRPLYFFLSETSLKTMQPIYKNFDYLSQLFRTFIAEDLEKLKKLNAPVTTSNIYNQISPGYLSQNHLDTKFKTLGFVYSLIEHANANFNANGDNGQSWMNFYAKSSRELIIEAKSLSDFANFNTGNYVLFFDEFEASVENAFGRNLFRSAMLPVFVANTNSNIANLVGLTSGNRIGNNFAWSLAIIMLNPINRSILNAMHPQLKRNIKNIIERGSNSSEKQLISLFFDDFLERQLKYLRPGFADIIATKINSICNQENFTLNDILSAIVDELSVKMIERKPSMQEGLEGILGSLALFLNNSYLSIENLGTAVEAKISHIKSYLQYHFYYLVNPVDVNKWCFLSYRPACGFKHLRVMCAENCYKNWDAEYSYFREEEIIGLFACQAVISSMSIPTALKNGLMISNVNPHSTGSPPNTRQRVPLYGNELEVIASTCIIEASQHKFGEEQSSFTGQSGESFLKNLIVNLIEADGYRRKDKIELDCAVIIEFLKRVHIPFLFPGGMELPDLFSNNFSKARGMPGRSVNFGYYERTNNMSEIDGFFNYFLIHDTRATVRGCSIECKNWNGHVLAKRLIPILEKAKEKSANLCLLFCNSLGNSQDGTLKNFVSFCKKPKKTFLVLKLKKTSVNKFELTPYCPGLPSVDEALLICIIIELDLINSGMGESMPKPRPKPKSQSKREPQSKPKLTKKAKPSVKSSFKQTRIIKN